MFILKSGRALLYPVYKSTYERGDGLVSDYPDETSNWKDHIIMWGKDLKRAIDYLESREDIDSEQLAYHVQRVKIPVLMLNGKYDFFFPYETSQVPYFELLATPAEHKKLVVHDTGHAFPRTERTRETLALLDRYLGPVQ